MSSADLSAAFSQAKSELGWSAGGMTWQYPHDSSGEFVAELACALGVAAASSATLSCTAVSDSVDDDWCNANCNHEPPNCPSSLCVCNEDADDDDDSASTDDVADDTAADDNTANRDTISGMWFYVADGQDEEHSYTNRTLPAWMASAQTSGNFLRYASVCARCERQRERFSCAR